MIIGNLLQADENNAWNMGEPASTSGQYTVQVHHNQVQQQQHIQSQQPYVEVVQLTHCPSYCESSNQIYNLTPHYEVLQMPMVGSNTIDAGYPCTCQSYLQHIPSQSQVPSHGSAVYLEPTTWPNYNNYLTNSDAFNKFTSPISPVTMPLDLTRASSPIRKLPISVDEPRSTLNVSPAVLPLDLTRPMGTHPMFNKIPNFIANPAPTVGLSALPNQVPPRLNNVHVQPPYAAMGMSASVGYANVVEDNTYTDEIIPVQSNFQNPRLSSQSSQVIIHPKDLDKLHSMSSPSLTLQSASASTATKISPAKSITKEATSILTQTKSTASVNMRQLIPKILKITQEPSTLKSPEIKVPSSTTDKSHSTISSVKVNTSEAESAPTPTASSGALSVSDQDIIQMPSTSKSLELKVDQCVSHKRHLIPKASFSDKQDQASWSQLEQPPLQCFKEKKYASPYGKIEKGSKSMDSSNDSSLSCGIPKEKQEREHEKEKGTSFDYTIVDDKKIQNKLQYTCNVTGCTKVFSTKEWRRKHEICHRGEKNFCCRYCDKTFALKFQYSWHMNNYHHSKKNFKCDLCQKEYYHKNKLRRHILLHMSNANQREPMKNHDMDMFPVVKAKQADLRPDFVCRLCKTLFQDLHDFNKHLQLQHDMSPYVCPWSDCELTFTHKRYLDRHKKTHYAAGMIFSCPICYNIYSGPDSLKQHLLTKH